MARAAARRGLHRDAPLPRVRRLWPSALGPARTGTPSLPHCTVPCRCLWGPCPVYPTVACSWAPAGLATYIGGRRHGSIHQCSFEMAKPTTHRHLTKRQGSRPGIKQNLPCSKGCINMCRSARRMVCYVITTRHNAQRFGPATTSGGVHTCEAKTTMPS